MQKKNNTVRNLITIGIFNAILIVMFMLLGFSASVIPAVLIVIPTILALVGGIIFMTMIRKAGMPGIFVISGAIMGLAFITMAPAGSMGLCIFLGGVIGEVVWGILGREKFVSAVVGFSTYMFGFAMGEYLPFKLLKDAYIAQESAKGTNSVAVAQQCIELLNFKLIAILSIITVVMAVVGCIWGRKLIETHFKKAGIV